MRVLQHATLRRSVTQHLVVQNNGIVFSDLVIWPILAFDSDCRIGGTFQLKRKKPSVTYITLKGD
jgi:hypothetical protein